MSDKALFVMDMPKNGCNDCSVCKEYIFKTICGITGNRVSGNRERGGFPEECPLKPMPDKWEECKYHTKPGTPVPLYRIGWNACIDAISGASNSKNDE